MTVRATDAPTASPHAAHATAPCRSSPRRGSAATVSGASQNAGLGNKFLDHIRQVDAILHCVRCFADANVTHVEGTRTAGTQLSAWGS